MAKKSYAVMNMSYRDETREEDYLLEEVEGGSSFRLPVTMDEFQYMYAGELTEMICQDALREIEVGQHGENVDDNNL